MSVPARKLSRSKVRRRRSHHSLKPQNLGECANCQKPILPHRACTNCGAYKGKQVLNVDVAEVTHAHTHESIDAHTHANESNHEKEKQVESVDAEDTKKKKEKKVS